MNELDHPSGPFDVAFVAALSPHPKSFLQVVECFVDLLEPKMAAAQRFVDSITVDFCFVVDLAVESLQCNQRFLRDSRFDPDDGVLEPTQKAGSPPVVFLPDADGLGLRLQRRRKFTGESKIPPVAL